MAQLVEVRPPARMFRHGYQSWSPAKMAVLGVDSDSSRTANLPFVRGVYHADGRQARGGELRSEWCTVLADDSGRELVAGFIAGTEHDVTFRLRHRHDGEPELVLEAYLGGAVLAAGESRQLHLPVAPPQPKSKAKTITREQLAKLMEAPEKFGHHMLPAICLAATTGARRGDKQKQRRGAVLSRAKIEEPLRVRGGQGDGPAVAAAGPS